MNKLKLIGVASGVAAMLMSAPVAFALEDGRAEVRTVTTRPVATTTRAEIKNTAREQMEAKREEAKTRMETKREEAKERIAKIKDERKKQLAEKLSGQFDRINKKWTDHFANVLDRYEEIIGKMRDRAFRAADRGNDASSATSAIDSAEVAVKNARDAVVAQAAKTYVLDTSVLPPDSGEDGATVKALREAFTGLHKSLFENLKALRDGEIKGAKEALHTALTELSSIKDVDDDGKADATGDGSESDND